MKRIDCALSISAIIECPECKSSLDLFSVESLTEGDYIYRQLIAQDGFGKKDWNEEIKCYKCHQVFIVGDVDWKYT